MPDSEKRNEICIYSAETNNLKSLSCQIPKNKFVVLTGPSGSGKSSLVFDTIADVASRKLDLYLSHARKAIEKNPKQAGKAKVELITGLPLTISFPKKCNSKLSTVASASGLYQPLYSLFMSLGKPHCIKCGVELISNSREEIVEKLQNSNADNIAIQAPLEFSKKDISETLNKLSLEGFTQVLIEGKRISIEELLDRKLSNKNKVSILIDSFATKNIGKSRIIESVILALKVGNGRMEAVIKSTDKEQLLTFSEIKFCSSCNLEQPKLTEPDFIYYSKTGACAECDGNNYSCPKCEGTRLNIIAGNYRLQEKSFKELLKGDIQSFSNWLSRLSKEIDKKTELRSVLDLLKSETTALIDLGLGYLNLNRSLSSVSSGELQRILLGKVLGMPLTGHLTLLDEPTNGLHPKDIDALGNLVEKFKENKNSIIAIEHDLRFVKKADYFFELGPKGGKFGGRLISEGSIDKISPSSATSNQETKFSLPKATQSLQVVEANINNLKNISLDISLSSLVSVVGVSGSGKSSLVMEGIVPYIKNKLSKNHFKFNGIKEIKGLENISRIKSFSGIAITKGNRSVVATVIDILTPLRELFASTVDAKIKGYNRNHFSFNHSLGRCQACSGSGLEKESDFQINLPCRTCLGTRFNQEVCQIKFKGYSIADVLKLTTEEALEIFNKIPKVKFGLENLKQVGLDYICLGQSTSTLSSGEQQRLKLAGLVKRQNWNQCLLVFDEPTRGLHSSEIDLLINFFRDLISKGASILAIEHNLQFISQSDQIIELGPEAGEAGGDLIFSGSVEEIINSPKSITGSYLKL